MVYTLSNHKPVALNPDALIPIAGDYDPLPAVKKVLVDPMYEPLVPGTQASLTDTNGADVDPDDLTQAMLRVMGDVYDPDAEIDVKNLFSQALIHYTGTSPLRTNELFSVQTQERMKLPHPIGTIKYLAQTDVIPAAKQILATGADDGSFAMSLAYAYAPDVLGYWFLNEDAFHEFKIWMQTQLAPIQPQFNADTNSSLGQFYNTKLDTIVEGMHIRVDDNDKLEEFSFARIVVHMLTQYSMIQSQAVRNTSVPQAPQAAGTLAFSMSELFLPRHVVLANVELHAQSTAQKIDANWRLIQQALTMKPKIIPNGMISKLTAMPRALAKARAQAANSASNKGAKIGRTASMKFKKHPPTEVDILKDLMRTLKRMGAVNKSQNAVRKDSTTFARANRRRPDDPNVPGRNTTTKYLPDIHIYLDCSGSVSEQNYQATVIMLIQLAKKMGINLYFSSFSTSLSQPTLLKVANKTVPQIWEEFRKIPKVNGGTSYTQIWEFINMSLIRKKRLNLIITDFEWTMHGKRVEHPRNAYYAPLAGMNWSYMHRSAKDFANSMQHIDPSIALKFLGMMK